MVVVTSGFVCAKRWSVMRLENNQYNNTQTHIHKYLPIHVLVADDEEECYRQGDPLSWMDMMVWIISP